MDSTQFTSDDIDIDAFRARLRKMTDEGGQDRMLLVLTGIIGMWLWEPACQLVAVSGKRRATAISRSG